MATPIINSQIDAINSTLGELADDLVTLRPLVKDVKDSVAASYITDTATGAIASFPDGADGIPVKDLKVAIEPVQNLNGQDAPWPAGGGVNKFAVNESATSSDVVSSASNATGIIGIADISTSKWATPYVGYTDVVSGKTYTMSGGVFPYGRLGGSTSSTNFPVSSNMPDTNIAGAVQSIITNLTATRTFTANFTGRIYWYFCTDSGNANHQAFNMQPVVAEGSTAQSWSPYSNICPISGRTGAEVYVRGVNLWDEEWEVGNIDDATGQNSTSTGIIRSVNYIPVVANTSYYSYVGSGAAMRIFFYDASKTFLRYINTGSTAFSIPSDAAYIRFRMYGAYGTTYNNDISINYPSTDHDYHAYNGNTYPISWQTEAGTVYGGTLDVTTGVLTINMAEVDMGTLTWSKYSPRFFAQIATTDPNCPKAPANDSAYTANAICSKYSVTNRLHVESVDNSFSIHNAGTAIYITVHDESLTSGDSTAFKNAMSGVQLVYELATPTTVQLTAAEVETVLGQNNIWANCGDVDVEYRADTKLYINKMIANALNA